MGGGVSAASLPFMRELPAGCLDRYETRKVIFECPAALENGADAGILKAVGFELMWLKNKRDFYNAISIEDSRAPRDAADPLRRPDRGGRWCLRLSLWTKGTRRLEAASPRRGAGTRQTRSAARRRRRR